MAALHISTYQRKTSTLQTELNDKTYCNKHCSKSEIQLFECIPKNAFVDIHIKTVQTTRRDVQSKNRSAEKRDWKYKV